MNRQYLLAIIVWRGAVSRTFFTEGGGIKTATTMSLDDKQAAMRARAVKRQASGCASGLPTESERVREILYQESTDRRLINQRRRSRKIRKGKLAHERPDQKHLKFTTGRKRRFWRKVQDGPGCWLWLGPKAAHGYGQYSFATGHHIMAHRYSWELLHGPIPPGMHIHHTCQIPACVNPTHLEMLTPVQHRQKHPRKAA